MSIRLSFVQFRNEGSKAFLPLRRLVNPVSGTSDSAMVGVPEWQQGVSSVPRDAPVAICAARTAAHPLRILIGLNREVGDPRRIWIRTRAEGISNLLGPVPPVLVDFQGQLEETVYATLAAPHRIVATHDDVWTWEWASDPNGVWKPLETTAHQVCVTLDVPQTPWDVSDETFALWLDILCVACKWGAGAQTLYDAASRVTRAVYSLGELQTTPVRFEYGGFSDYTTDDFFDGAGFLATMNGTAGLPPCLNCCACASLVATFANALGCVLFEARIAGQSFASFRTNLVRLIGKPAIAATAFGFHELAWAGNAGAKDPVWDACLLVDGDKKPGFQGMNATGLPFGAFSDKRYFWQLIDATSAPHIELQGKVGPGNRNLGSMRRGTAPALDSVIHPGRWFYWNFRDLWRLLTPWSPGPNLPATEDGSLPYYDATWKIGDKGLVRVEVDAAHSFAEAEARLLQRRGLYSVPVVDMRIGDAGFGVPKGSHVTFQRGNLVITMGSACSDEDSVVVKAQQLDNLLSASLPTLQPGIDISPQLPTTDSQGSPLWYRARSPTGEVRVVDNTIRYFAATSAPQFLTVYRYDATGGETTQQIPIS